MDLCGLRSLIVFGGTFDPPHLAHVRLAMLARQAVSAEAVAFVPAAVSPLKRGHDASPPADRLAMLRLAVSDEPLAVVLTDELDRAADGKPSYTVDTLESLRARLSPTVTLHLLIGADQLRLFPRWHRSDRIVELAEPLVMVRPPDTRDALLAALPAGLDPREWAPRLLDLPMLDLSATKVRQRARDGLSLDGLVHPEVARYIAEHGLYR